MIFDAKGKRKVTADWSELFPAMQVWKPARLVKRHGPLLIGICLDGDRSNQNYTPKAHFHVLCVKFPTVALGLVGELEQRGIPKRIPVTGHEMEYKAAAEELRVRYPFLEKQRLDFNDFVLATSDYLSGKHGRIGQVPFQHGPFEGIITVAACMGHTEYAQKALNDFSKRISTWPERGLNIIGSADGWRAKMQEVIDASDELKQIVNSQIAEHKLEKITDHGFDWSEKPARQVENPATSF